MKKIRILQIIELIILVIIAIGLISFLSSVSKKSMHENNNEGFSFNFDFDLSSGESKNLKVLKEEQVSGAGIQEIELKFNSTNIEIAITDDKTINIIESAVRKLNEDELFTLVNQNGKLIVEAGKRRQRFILFGAGFNRHKVKLLLPKTYTQDLKISTSSGDVKILSDLKLRDIDVNQASGDFRADYMITAQNFNGDLASGDIRMKYLESGKYALSTASGDITIDFIKGSGDIETRSGDIRFKELIGGKYNLSSASGDISLKNVYGSGEIKTASGDIRAAYQEIQEYSKLSATSGDIDIALAEGISFEMEAKCISGEIQGTLDMDYKNRKASEAKAVIGQGPYATLTINTASGDITVNQN
ncbi:DUF4097 family beta strand repeat-containing protein [Cellulosilyticum sp. I15G10I2]|uniref:DUF4097 family beta strand repeat-containing protein n=1 Tax=Cellulosilyticum sp. I15G10I2 TaxID=1892843 RepID=UPI00085BC45B|nr:DUF4097 family beta strand repeat-containing protein [Cellulosilyticum sp. I15G10I2]